MKEKKREKKVGKKEKKNRKSEPKENIEKALRLEKRKAVEPAAPSTGEGERA